MSRSRRRLCGLTVRLLLKPLILSTSSTDTDILRAYHLGANCYVSKPVGLDDFLRAIHGIENLWLNPARLPAYSPREIV